MSQKLFCKPSDVLSKYRLAERLCPFSLYTNDIADGGGVITHTRGD